MNYEERNELFNTLRNHVEDILIEGSFYGKSFSIPFEKKVTKADRDDIINMFKLNYKYFENISSTTSLLTFECFEFSPEDIIHLYENVPAFTETLYPSNHVFDENMSVKWNREEIARRNEEIKNRKARVIKLKNILESMFKESLIKDAIYMNDTFKDIPLSAFDPIYSKAYEDGHSYGFYEVKSYFNDEISMIEDFLLAMKKK